MIYHVEEVVAGTQWKLAIVGTESINGCFGADFYCYNQGSNAWSTNNINASEQ